MADQELITGYEFDLIGQEENPFAGYVSSKDRTNVSERVLVFGSKNMYKKLNGNWANRAGLKRWGIADATIGGITAEDVWETSLGKTIPLRVVNYSAPLNKLQYESDILTPGSPVWYDLMTMLTPTRFVFDHWWNDDLKKDENIFCNGTPNLYEWSGGISLIGSATNAMGVVAELDPVATVIGSGYAVGDILSITTGGTGATVEVLSLANQEINSVSIANGGVGYVVDDIITIPGVISGASSTVRVTTVGGGGVVTGIVQQTVGGNYGTGQTNVATTGGTGGFFRITYTVTDTGIDTFKILTRGSGYTIGTGKATTAVTGTGTGATLHITQIAQGTITKADTSTTWAEDGFSPGLSGDNTIIVGANQFTYSGGTDSSTLYGISADPSFIPANSLVVQAVVTTPNATANGIDPEFNNDFLKIVNNQVYVGSYNSRLTYISSNAAYTEYIVPSPRALGDPELITLDANGQGIGLRSGQAHIFAGSSYLHIVSFTNITVGTVLTQQTSAPRQDLADLEGALAHEFIATVGDNLVYLSQENQLVDYGSFRNLTQNKYPSLSLPVRDELQAENFTGGHLKCVDEFIYITAPLSGLTYFHQTRESLDSVGNITAERLWHTPHVWSTSRLSVINGILYGHSNINPQIYQLLNTGQWHDDSPNLALDGLTYENLPYYSVMRMAYRNHERRQGFHAFDKAYFEGYMTQGTELDAFVLYDYQGARGIQNPNINSIQDPAKFFSGASSPSLGDGSLGDNPLGDGIITDPNSFELLPKFRAIPSLNPVNCFEYQIIVYSNNLDDRWEMLCLGTNAQIARNQQAGYLNK